MPTTTTPPEPEVDSFAEVAEPVDELPDDDEPVVVGELVPHVEDPTGQRGANAAIEAAARAAIEQPGIPGRDEFLSLAMQARMLAGSGLCPKALRGNPADVFMVLLTGRDVGIPVTSALRQVHVIEGMPSLAPKLRCAIVRRQGLGSVVPEWGSCASWAAAMPLGPGGLDPACKRARRHVAIESGDPSDCECDLLGDSILVTWQDAKAAGLVGLECYPTADGASITHSEPCDKGTKGSLLCKNNWRTYPKRMLWWRAAGYAVDDYFPEVGMGLYSPDELGAVTDDDGVPIDPTTAALPAGFEQAEKATSGAARQQEQAQQQAARQQPGSADPEAIADLKLRARLLPVEVADELRARWKASEKLAPFTFDSLPADLVNLVGSMVRGFEAVAKRNHPGWTAEQAMADHVAGQAPQEAQDGPDGVPGPDGADPTSDAVEGDTGVDDDGIVDAVVVEPGDTVDGGEVVDDA